MTDEEKTCVFQLVAQVLISDGILSDAEHEHLSQLGGELSISDENRRSALQSVSLDSPIEERVDSLGDDVKSQLKIEVERAVALESSDKKVHPLVAKILNSCTR